MRRFIAREFKRASIFRAMRDQGFQVDAVSGLMYDRPSATTYYRLPTPYVPMTPTCGLPVGSSPTWPCSGMRRMC